MVIIVPYNVAVVRDLSSAIVHGRTGGDYDVVFFVEISDLLFSAGFAKAGKALMRMIRYVMCFFMTGKQRKKLSESESFLYLRPESNRHARRHMILSQARLPIPPLRHLMQGFTLWQMGCKYV